MPSSEEEYSALIRDMLLKAWGLFYNRINNYIDQYESFEKCESEYNEFLKKVYIWFPETCDSPGGSFLHLKAEILKRIDWGEIAIIGGISIASGVAAVTFPPAAPAIAITASTLIEGGSEVYTQLKLRQKVRWDKVLTKSIGGAVKGGICIYVPGAVATGIGIAGTATLENYLYSTISGDSSPEALSGAFINRFPVKSKNVILGK